jgi:hypothetical protein
VRPAPRPRKTPYPCRFSGWIHDPDRRAASDLAGTRRTAHPTASGTGPRSRPGAVPSP